MNKYIVRESPYKKIGKTLRYNQPAYTARTCLMLPAVKQEALKQVLTAVKVECRHLCQLKPRPSTLRVKSVGELKSFSWSEMMQELKRKAPTLLATLRAAAQSHLPRSPPKAVYKKRGRQSKLAQRARDSVVGMAAAVLLKERNQHMCKLQTLVSTLLYAGHASKKVTGILVTVTYRLVT